MTDDSYKSITLHTETAGRTTGPAPAASEAGRPRLVTAPARTDRLPDALDRHAAGSRQNHIALRWVSRSGRTQDLTYRQLRSLTNHFANLLRNFGVSPGERVAALTGPIPELCVAALGTVRNHSIFCPLDPALDADALFHCLASGKTRVLLTTEQLYREKVAPRRPTLPTLERVLLIGESNRRTFEPGTENYQQLLATAGGGFSANGALPGDLALSHFIRSPNDPPHEILLSHEAALARLAPQPATDLLPDDLCWCAAAPGTLGWTLYGLLAPILHGATGLLVEAEFEPEEAYRLIAALKVNVWYLAADQLCRLRDAGAELARRFDLQSLRFLAVTDDPASAANLAWAAETFTIPVHQAS